MTAATLAAPTRPREPMLDRPSAMRLAREAYQRIAEAARELHPDDWHRPTANDLWDVHAMLCHVAGMAELAASPLEQRRQVKAAQQQSQRAGGEFIDALTALQAAKHAHRSPQELVEVLSAVGPRAAKGRARTPGFIRRRRMPEEFAIDGPDAPREAWTIGYLVDVILTRDTWMHRSDLAEATGRPMRLTADHDGILVADVVAEWASRHGQPCSLTLTGPAGGAWEFGAGGPSYELDAVQFCRILSGRGSGDGLLAQAVPF